MSFPQLREAFDQDSEELSSFSLVLQRELTTATGQLSRALASADSRTVGDLKHKLKTSLQLVDANHIKTQLAEITAAMNQGISVSPQQQRRVVEDLEKLVLLLQREKW